MKEKTCCFTGHRKIPLNKVAEIRKKLATEIISLIDKGYTDFVAGGALGFDTLAADTVLEIKKSYGQIKLHLILPCCNQDSLWTNSQKSEYERILKSADSHEYVSKNYTRYCMFERNRKMVELSSAVIAFYDFSNKGGTAMTVNYAVQKRIQVINIY